MFISALRLTAMIGMVGLPVAAVGTIYLAPQLWQSPLSFLGVHQEGHSFEPVDAVTLAGQPGLYYRQAANLVGIIDPTHFSAYDSLVQQGKIPAGATILTDQSKLSIPTSTPTATPTPASIISPGMTEEEIDALLQDLRLEMDQTFVSQIEAGLGLSSSGQGKIQLNVVPGTGIVIHQDKVVAALGDSVDLLQEVTGVLSVANGGTGLNQALDSGKFLLSDGTKYIGGSLLADDGLVVEQVGNTLTYSLDATVCRTSGNCAGSGGTILGSGVIGQLAFFSAADTITGQSGLSWDSDGQELTIDGDIDITGQYLVNGNPISTSQVMEGTNLYYTTSRFDTDFAGKDTDDLAEGQTALYWTDNRFDLRLATKDTDDLAEGNTNLYFTQLRVSQNSDVTANTAARHEAASVADTATLDLSIVGQQISGSLIQSGIQASLINNDAGFVTNLSSFTTTNLAEGSNLYWTQARFDTAFSTAIGQIDTDSLSEGESNLYWTQVRFDTAFSAAVSNIDTDDIDEGETNLFFSQLLVSQNSDVSANTAARHEAVTVADSSSIDFTLTGQQISASILQSAIQTSQVTNDAGFIANLSGLTTDNLTEGESNLYWTDNRFDTAFSSKSAITGSGEAGQVVFLDSEQTVAGSLALTWDDESDVLTVGGNVDAQTFNGLSITTTTGTLAIGSGLNLNVTTASKTLTGSGTQLSIANNLTFGSGTTGTITLGTGSHTLQLTTTGNTNVTLPTSGTLTTGTGSNGEVSFWNGTNSLSSSSGLAFNNSSQSLSVGAGAEDGEIFLNNTGTGANTYIMDLKLGFNIDQFGGDDYFGLLGSHLTINAQSFNGSQCVSKLELARYTAHTSSLNFCDGSVEFKRNNAGTTNRAEIVSDQGLQFTSANNSAFTIGGTSNVVINGGTLVITPFDVDGGVLYTDGSGNVSQTAAGNQGECLQSNGSGAPTWGACDEEIVDDSLDFDKLSDSLSLDASTAIALGSYTLSISGDGGLSFAHTGDTTFSNSITIGTGNNTITLNPSSGLSLSGTSRPTKTLIISPEYPGATFMADGSVTTEGTMISGNTLASASAFRSYYEWKSENAELQDYTIVVRVALPSDFDSWADGSCPGPNCALELMYQTGTASAAENAVNFKLFEVNDGVNTVCDNSTDRASTTWTSANMVCSHTTLDDDTDSEWDEAGEVAIFKIVVKASSAESALARVGELTLRYKARF